MKNLGLRGQSAQVQDPALTLHSCLTLDKFPNFSASLFLINKIEIILTSSWGYDGT